MIQDKESIRIAILMACEKGLSLEQALRKIDDLLETKHKEV